MKKIHVAVFLIIILINVTLLQNTINLYNLKKGSLESLTNSKINLKSFKKIRKGNFLILFKNSNVVKKIAKYLGDKVISFYPLPILLIKERLSVKDLKILFKYRFFIKSINENNKIFLNVTFKEFLNTPKSVDTLDTINATILHKLGIKGEGVKIGIIDTGIWEHPDLKGRIIAEKSFVLKKYGYTQDDEDPVDRIGHGTSVAGVAAGDGSNDPSKIGVAPRAYLVNAKVFQGDSLSNAIATDAGIIAAIRWCVLEANVDIINLSIGAVARLNDPLIAAVDWAAKRGVIVVVAAGNEGEDGLGTMQISTPGASKYVITVGASDGYGKSILGFSSIGPIYDMSVKPDIVAPGEVTAPWLRKSAFDPYYRTVRGTSFSAPHVSGAVALLLGWLKNTLVNLDKKALSSIVKTSLLAAAKSFNLPDTLEGAGLLNVGMAWWLLKKKINLGEIPPKIIYCLPKKLPAGFSFPWNKYLFRGMKIEFNETIYSTYNTTLYMQISGNVSKILKNTSIEIHYPFTNFEFRIIIPDNVPIGKYVGEILFSDQYVSFKIPISFTIEEPNGFILFDLRHTSWIMDSKYGQYRKFFELAESMHFAVEQIYWWDKPLTFEELVRYDLVFMPDVLSYYRVFDENGLDLGLKSREFTFSEIEAFIEYVSQGGSIIFIAMDPSEQEMGNNLTSVNSFSYIFGTKFGSKVLTSDAIQSKVVSDNPFGLGGEILPYYGTYIEIIPNSDSIPFIEANIFGDKVIVASLFTDVSGGFIIFTATNFFFDNWAFNGLYGTSANEAEYVKKFHKKILTYLTYKKNILVSPLSKNLTFGNVIDVNVTIVNISYLENTLKFYYIDRLGSIEISEFEKIGKTSYRVTIFPRHARNVYISTHFETISGEKIMVSKPIYIIPSEYNPPKITSIAPSNGSTISENMISSGYITINLTIEDDTKILPELIKVIVFVENNWVNHTIIFDFIDDNKTINLLIKIEKRDILSYMFLKPVAKLEISIVLYDVNLNYVKATFIFEVSNKTQSSIIMYIATIFFLMTFVIISLVVYESQKRSTRKKLQKLFTPLSYNIDTTFPLSLTNTNFFN